MRYKDYLAEVNKIKLLDINEERGLWLSYKEQDDAQARRTLIEHYQPLVVKVVSRWWVESIQMDLVQEGTVGLIEAVESFNPDRGVAFSLFAIHRIRGRILNWFEREQCRVPEVSDAMQEAEKLADPQPSVGELAENNFLVEQLHKALNRLPCNERLALSGIYIEGKEPGQMASFLQVTPSHISRLQKQGIRRVRGMMSRLMAELKK